MYDSSIYYYEKSLKYSCTRKFVCNISQFTWESWYNISVISGNPTKAIAYYKKGIDQAKMVDDIYELWWIYRDMSNMYLQLGDTSNAYRNYVLFKKYSDIWISKGNSERPC